MSAPNRRGILIANLGSPDSPNESDVSKFLREFLMDPHVVNLPWLLRALLVYAVVVPTRTKTSAANYRSIWDCEAGPLRDLTNKLSDAIASALNVPTVVGMRYGTPSLESAMRELDDVEDLLVISLYPQHADSTRTTIAEKIVSESGNRRVSLLRPFYQRPDYMHVLRTHLHKHLQDDAEHLLMSFHSLPVSHLKKADTTGAHCMKTDNCCAVSSEAHAYCYRHQCIRTAQMLGEGLGIPTTITYQSRLGRLEWLEPSTVDVLAELAGAGVRKVAVACPSFVVDNLETLSEIAIEAKDVFRQNGGETLQLIPALNESKDLVDLFVSWISNPDGMFEELPSQ